MLRAQGFDAKADLLAQLVAPNLAVGGGLAAGEPVTSTGVPPACGAPARLITDDCIRP